MISKKNIVLTSFAALGAALLVLTQTAGSNPGPQSNKLAGAFVLSTPGTPLLFNGVFAPSDPSGHSAVIYGSLLVRIPAELWDPDVAPVDHGGDYVGEAVMTGPDTAKLTIVGHGIQKVEPSDGYPFFEKVAWVWVVNGVLKFNAAGTIDCTFTLTDYPPGADGLADTSKPALFSMEAGAKMTRVGF
jgi:hypothetical protein